MHVRGLLDLNTHFSDDKNTIAICTKTRAAGCPPPVATDEDRLRQVCCVYPLDCHVYEGVHETLMVWRVLQLLQVAQEGETDCHGSSGICSQTNDS